MKIDRESGREGRNASGRGVAVASAFPPETPLLAPLTLRVALLGSCLFVLMAGLAATASEVSAAPLFEAKTDFATGTDPRSVTSDDFNGDKKPDLAVANYDSNSVSVLLGDGTGSFGPKTDFPTGSFPSSVTSDDLNGDKKPDLAVANYNSDTVSVLLGDGTGSFGPKTDFTTGTGPHSVITDDFNADNKPDLAVANAGSAIVPSPDTVSVLLGDGTGSFGAKTDFATGTGPSSVTTDDFNGDEKPDLASANAGSNTVSVLLGDGTGSFGAKTDFLTGSSPGSAPVSVTTGDFNGDDKPDLAAANANSSTVSVLLGDGTGGFGLRTDFTTRGSVPLSLITGDFNGDEKPDLAYTGETFAWAEVLLGDGTGGFGERVDTPATGAKPYSLITDDFNGDGKPDLAVANADSDTVSVLLGEVEPPDTQIDSGPSGISNDSPSFAFTSSEPDSTFECMLDDGGFSPCSSPKSYSGLTEGPHTFEVRAIDLAGNTDPAPATRSFTVDATPPETQIDTGPTDTIAVNEATFTFVGTPSSDTARVQCRIDNGPFADCSSPKTFTGLTDGTHTAEFRAEDAVGNQDPTPATRRFAVDALPPTASLAVSPNLAETGEQVSLDATASFDPGDRTIVSYDWDVEGDGTFESTSSSGLKTHSYGQPGTFNAAVRVTDSLGRSAVASQPVEVRLAPPSGPLGVSINAGAQFTNDPNVAISAVWPYLATKIVVSNDGGFGSSQTSDVSAETLWTLDSSGPERLPKTVYIRFVGGESGPETYQDDIILDETPPTVSSATVTEAGQSALTSLYPLVSASSRSTVTLKASDQTSGLGFVQTAVRKDRPSAKRKYQSSFTVEGAKPEFVRVQDRAGNFSKWKELSKPSAVIKKVTVKGPRNVKRGKKATYKVKITNSGNAKATGVRLKVKGRGVSFNTSVGKIGAKKTRTVKIRLKAKKPGKVKVAFKVTSKNAGGKTVKKKIRVRK